MVTISTADAKHHVQVMQCKSPYYPGGGLDPAIQEHLLRNSRYGNSSNSFDLAIDFVYLRSSIFMHYAHVRYTCRIRFC